MTLGKGGGERATPEEMHALVRALQAAMTAAETPTAQMSPVVNDPRGGAADGIGSS